MTVSDEMKNAFST